MYARVCVCAYPPPLPPPAPPRLTDLHGPGPDGPALLPRPQRGQCAEVLARALDRNVLSAVTRLVVPAGGAWGGAERAGTQTVLCVLSTGGRHVDRGAEWRGCNREVRRRGCIVSFAVATVEGTAAEVGCGGDSSAREAGMPAAAPAAYRRLPACLACTTRSWGCSPQALPPHAHATHAPADPCGSPTC